MEEYFLVYTTTDSNEIAIQISKILINEKLAACCSIINNSTSFYIWDNSLIESSEHMLMIKTNSKKLDELIDRIKEIHNYQLPEIIAVPIVKGNDNYLKWIGQSLEQ